MKNRFSLIFIVILLFSINQVYSQMAVTAPVLEQQNLIQNKTMATMSSTIAALEASEKKVNQVMQSAKWVKDLNTVKKLVVTMETLACNTKDLDVYMSIYGGNCIISMNYNFQLLKINGALDNVSVLMASGLYMSPGDRMQLLNDAIEKFTEAQTALGNLNSFFEKLLARQEHEEKLFKGYETVFTMERKY